MKKLLSILIIFLFVSSAFSQSLELAKRYLKLANTYINTEDFDKANDNLNKAKDIISRYKSWDAKYWDAVADETLGNLYLKNGVTPLAQISYETALMKYKKLIRTKDGSQEAVQELLNRITGLDQTSFTLQNGKAKVISLDNTKKVANDYELPPTVESYSCNNCNMRDFPYNALEAPNLKTLILSNNRIRDFEVKPHNKITYLDISNNRIKEIRGSFTQMSNLIYLDISGNSLKTIPEGIESLKKLKVLKITNNKIPFAMIKNLIQSLPNTLIVHDNYVLESQTEEDIFPGE
ncbi:MAG: hypothetical protein A2X64_10060 [Ignavibacteria bacterium GWF2_33_9]|nr:MAG: hypothetical protein A2X64_10060 [Ignavibacteria bacterium GWF2_33_9]